jgi:hypothetical protein
MEMTRTPMIKPLTAPTHGANGKFNEENHDG